MVAAFRQAGIEAAFDEATPDAQFALRVHACESLTGTRRARIAKALLQANSQQVQDFMASLKRAVNRKVVSVRVLPLHGSASEWRTLREAVAFVQAYDEAGEPPPIVRYEIQVLYSNGDRIDGQFADKHAAVQFLRQHQDA